MVFYTALGDSITAGESASTPALAYPGRIVDALQRRRIRVHGEVLAEPGWTSRSLNHAVIENAPQPLAASTAITIWIGGDNLAYAGLAMLQGASPSIIKRAIAGYARDMALLVTSIRRVSRARIILCTQYNPFPNTPLASEAIAALNTSTYTLGEKLGVRVAPASSWIDGRQNSLIAGYRSGMLQDVLRQPRLPIHPNDLGHAAIAQGLFPYIHP